MRIKEDPDARFPATLAENGGGRLESWREISLIAINPWVKRELCGVESMKNVYKRKSKVELVAFANPSLFLLGQ